MQTIGDIYGIQCPNCGQEIRDLWDMGIALECGAAIACPFCGDFFVIADMRDHFIRVEEK